MAEDYYSAFLKFLKIVILTRLVKIAGDYSKRPSLKLPNYYSKIILISCI